MYKSSKHWVIDTVNNNKWGVIREREREREKERCSHRGWFSRRLKIKKNFWKNILLSLFLGVGKKKEKEIELLLFTRNIYSSAVL